LAVTTAAAAPSEKMLLLTTRSGSGPERTWGADFDDTTEHGLACPRLNHPAGGLELGSAPPQPMPIKSRAEVNAAAGQGPRRDTEDRPGHR